MITKNVHGMSLAAALMLTGMQAGTPAIAQGSFIDTARVASAHSAGTYGSDSLPTQGNQTSTITFGQTVQGALGDANDRIFEDGTPYDQYTLSTSQANKPYVITVNSSDFAPISTVIHYDPEKQQAIPQQGALVWAPNMQVQYSGTLSETGQYLIHVFALDNNLGKYSLSLGPGATTTTSAACTSGACESSGGQDPFISIGPNAPMNCTLSSDAEFVWTDGNGGKHYTKPFRFRTTGGALTIKATSTAFTPVIIVFDSETLDILGMAEHSYTDSFGPGDVYFLVSSAEAGLTGAFSVMVDDNNSNGGFSSFDASSVPLGPSGSLHRQ